MEEKIRKILSEKDENIVQFNLINNTNQNQFIDLFDTSNLTVVPTSSTTNPPTSQTSVSTSLLSYRGFTINPLNGDMFLSSQTGVVRVYDLNGVLITNIPLLFQAGNSTYCISNNTLYVTSQNSTDVAVIDCATYTVIQLISGFVSFLRGAEYSPIANQVYVLTQDVVNPVQVIDCNSNTIIATPVSPPFSLPLGITYNSLQNQMYVALTNIPSIGIYDCNTNLLISTVPLLLSPHSLTFCPTNNSVYIGYQGLGVNQIDVLNCNTNTIIASIPYVSVSSVIFDGVFASPLNLLYIINTTDNSIYEINPTNNTISNTIIPTNPFTTFNPTVINYNNFTGNLYVGNAGKFYLFAGALTPFYISGSSNYNSFVLNLNNEPIDIKMIRLLVQNQEQLYNEIQFTKIDSNGNQIFFPQFPITKIDTEQDQANISEIEFNGLVFDGRTYINQYQLNPNETVSVEIYYKQLDLTSASRTYPIFFKPKVQLKEYIKKELNL